MTTRAMARLAGAGVVGFVAVEAALLSAFARTEADAIERSLGVDVPRHFHLADEEDD